ncbi:phosphatase PAP2 family protein [Nocardia shimofusensis]|uniref:phosphatase PAP2 family protein n=1 Tax=Nocardia shimofusensis TaxID=228596 RepID=UPI0009FF6CB4|nr:phosphatase PAP2 family protein [Nocardia shimofusensis]
MLEQHAGVRIRAVTATAGALTMFALPLTFPPGGGPTSLDSAAAGAVAAGPPSAPDRWLVAPSDAPVVLAALLLAVGWFAWRRRWLAAVTMLVVPELALVVNTVVLKPLFDRELYDYLAYPSGHTVHMVAVACTFVLLSDSRRARRVVTAVAGLALIAAAAGQVGMGHHHLTDVIGGAAAGLAIAVTCCTAVELVTGRHETGDPGTRRDARTPRPGDEPQAR